MKFKVTVLITLSYLAELLQAASFYNVSQVENGISEFASPRIVNGHDAVLGQFPYQVLLRSKLGVACGGSIISKNYILTAAHCLDVSRPASDYYILAGTKIFDSSSVRIPIAQLIVHPSYKNPTPFDNDIALLKLGRPLSFNNDIKAIPLETEEIKSGEIVVVSGWGLTKTGSSVSRTLQYTELRAISTGECAKKNGRTTPYFLCLDHINGNGICSGDSGGPAAYKGRLAGVVNFTVNGCAGKNADGFAKVSSYLDFIRANSDVK